MKSFEPIQRIENNSGALEVLPPKNLNEREKQLSDEEVKELIGRAKAYMKSKEKIRAVQKDLGIDAYSTEEEIVGKYDGDWTLLLRQRMSSPEIKKNLLPHSLINWKVPQSNINGSLY